MAEPTHDEHLTQIRDRSRRLAEIPLETSASNYIMCDMIDSIGDVRWLLEQLERQQTLAATVAEAMSEAAASSWYDDAPITDEQIESVRRDLDSPPAERGAAFAPFVVRKMLAEIDRLNTVLDANCVVRNAAESSSRTYKAVVDRLKAERTELRAENDHLRAQLAEIGETREEFGVRVDGCTDTIGVYPGRESAEENLALWRKVWPSSEFTLMQRENRAAVVSGWREVPDA